MCSRSVRLATRRTLPWIEIRVQVVDWNPLDASSGGQCVIQRAPRRQYLAVDGGGLHIKALFGPQLSISKLTTSTMKFLYILASLIAASNAQFGIRLPKAGDVVKPGSNITVQLIVPFDTVSPSSNLGRRLLTYVS